MHQFFSMIKQFGTQKPKYLHIDIQHIYMYCYMYVEIIINRRPVSVQRNKIRKYERFQEGVWMEAKGTDIPVQTEREFY